MPFLLDSDLNRPLPAFTRVRQLFDREHLEVSGIPSVVRGELNKEEIRTLVKPGMRVAVAVGSRGIKNLFMIVEATVRALQELGAKPFIVSAMGSHGGGTEEGQREVLAGYGITEEALGIPVVTSVDTVHLGDIPRRKNAGESQLGREDGAEEKDADGSQPCPEGRPVWFDRAAMSADLIVPVNRIKLHTDFVGPLQSGLCKMLVIGLGNHKGCSAVHEESPEIFADVIEETASLILKKAPVGFGVAILENAYDQTLQIEAVPAARLIEREKELCRIAKEHMPFIMLPEADVIVCQYIGKDISGAGFDPNILGRSTLLKTFVLHIPKYQRLVLSDLTPASHGNGIGVGLFDVITQRVFDKLDRESMYANAIACNCLLDASIPCTVEDEETAIRVALKCCRGIDRENPKIIRIQDTLHLEYLEVTPALLEDVKKDPRLEIV